MHEPCKVLRIESNVLDDTVIQNLGFEVFSLPTLMSIPRTKATLGGDFPRVNGGTSSDVARAW